MTVALLLTCLPLAAAAQRVEVTFFAGAYVPVPSQRLGLTGDICDTPPCPTHYDETLQTGKSFGGQLSFHFGSRFGVEATVQHSTATGSRRSYDLSAGAVFGSSPLEFSATFISLQPHVRVPLGESLDISFAAGPAITTPLGASRSEGALALSGAIRARFSRAAVFQVRISDTHLLGAVRNADRDYLTVHCGLGLALTQ